MKFRPLLSIDWSGKIGNQVASSARGGIQYLRALVIPRNPNTFLQDAARQAMASAAVIWNTVLTEAQREAWWDGAEQGQTGQGLFTRVNQPRIFAINANRFDVYEGSPTPANLDPILSGPPPSASTPFTPPSGIVIDDSANTLTIGGVNGSDPFAADSTDGTPGAMFVYASHQQSPSRLSRQHPYQLVSVGLFGDPGIVVSPTISLAALGLTTETGKVMYVKTYVEDALGARSTISEQRVTITA